jgi:hypothetical protein
MVPTKANIASIIIIIIAKVMNIISFSKGLNIDKTLKIKSN